MNGERRFIHDPERKNAPGHEIHGALWSRMARTVCRLVRNLCGCSAPSPIRPTADAGLNRRQLLHSLGLWPWLGLFAWSRPSRAAEDGSSTPARPVVITEPDAREYHRLKRLDLQSPDAATRQGKMPTGTIGSLTLGRLISGSNLISLNMHARDLGYVQSLAAHYNTEDRVFMTLKKCEEMGINGIVLKNHNFRQFNLANYWKEWGGRMKWIADVITTDINQYERLLEEHLELGAAAAYLWGGASDTWYHQNKLGNIVRAYEIMRRYKIPVGIGAHRLEPIQFCEKEGLAPDFYLKTLHHDRYWSAHPKANRRYMEMYEKESEDHAEYHDNMFCHDAEQTIEFMQSVKAPWIAFKVLAAGAISAPDGIRYAFANGADFICLGMFDFQVEPDAELVIKAASRLAIRARPWSR